MRPLRSDVNRIIVAVGAALIVLVTALLLMPGGGPLHREFDKTLIETDFRAFYCASLVTRQRDDPYLTAPLEHCEEFAAPIPGTVPGSVKILDPAPMPGYDFAILAPISLIPFYPAAILWNALLAFCLLLTGWLLSRMSGIPVCSSSSSFS